MADGDQKKLQGYLDTIKARTGKTPEDFRAMAEQKGLRKAREIVTWLNTDYGLGYQQAGAISYLLLHTDDVAASADEKIAAHFAGTKSKWRKPYDALAKKLIKFGADVEISPNMTYINVLRGRKKFAIVQTSAERMDIGIKLKDAATTDKFEAAGSWNVMLSHRVRISDPKQIDAEVLAWLKQAYDAAE